MALSAQYYTSGALNFIDFSHSPTPAGATNETFLVVGSAGDDWIYVPEGVDVNFNNPGTGNNRLYLSGALSDYTQEIVDADYGIYKFTRTANLSGANPETAWFTVDDNNAIYFQNGKVSFNEATLAGGGSFRLIDVTDLNGADPTPTDPRGIAGLENNGSTRIYLSKGGTTGIPPAAVPGQSFVITGGAGNEVAFVTPGTNMDFRDTGTGTDTLYLTGKFSDYAQTVDADYGVYTFTRIAGLPAGRTEVIKIRALDDPDALYFADGGIVLQVGGGAPTYAGGPLDQNDVYRLITAADLDLGMITPGLDTTPPVAPAQAGTVNDDNGPATTLPLIREDTPSLTLPVAPGPGEVPVLVIDGVVVPATYDSATQTLMPSSPLPDGPHTIAYALQDDFGNISSPSPSVAINVEVVNQIPLAVIDSGTAVEDGTSLGSAATGNVLDNDIDTDGGEVLTVSAVDSGTVDVEFATNYGKLKIDSTGGYTYTVDNSNATVDALRLSSDTLIESFTYTVSDSQNASSVAVLSVTITGANDAPVGNDDIATAQEPGVDAVTDPTGNLLANDTDVDTGDVKKILAISGAAAGTVNGDTAGSYGTLTLDDDGNYTYVVDDTNPAVNAMWVSSDTLIDTFTYTVKDLANATSTAVLKVTITGANDAPVASNDTVTAEESGLNSGTSPTGVLLSNDTDVDTGDTIKISAVTGAAAGVVNGDTSGNYGKLTLDEDGNYTYTVDDTNATVNALLDATQTLIDTFTYTIKDQANVTATAQLTVTITGANDAPIANDDTATAQEPGVAAVTSPTGNLLGNDTDVDTGDVKKVLAISGAAAGTVNGDTVGNYGTLTLDDDGNYSYTVDDMNATVNALWIATDTLTDTFTYTVKDLAGETAVGTLTVTITGSNDAPTVVTAIDDQLAVRGEAIAEILTAAHFTDVDTGDSLTFSMTGAPTGLSIDPATGKINGTPTQAGSFDITVTATDAAGVAASVQDTFTMAVDDSVLLLAGQTIENLSALDVGSPIVLKFDQNIDLATGQIRIMDDNGINGLIVKNTFDSPTIYQVQDTHDNDVYLTLNNGVITEFKVGSVDLTANAAGSLTVSGQYLIINPSGDHSAAGNTAWNFDWDFGTNYHIEIDAGTLKSSASGAPSEEISGARLSFSTVTPAPDATGAASVKINSADASVENSYIWHSAHVGKDSSSTGGVAMNFENGAHALVVMSSLNARESRLPGKVNLSYFGFTSSNTVTSDDLLYNDNLGDMSMTTTEILVAGRSPYPWNQPAEPGQGPNRSLSVESATGGGGMERVVLMNVPSGWTSITRDNVAEDATHYNANVIVFG